MLGVGTEDAIDAVRGEPQREETLLKLGYVIALEHVAGDVREHPVTELPAGSVQSDVGVRPEHSVDDQAAPLLEGPDRLGDLVVIDVGGFGG